MQRDWNAMESGGGYRDGKNTRSYSDNYANGSPASKTTPAQPAPTTVALAHSLGGDLAVAVAVMITEIIAAAKFALS
jgi:hypothetical protein